MVHFQLSLPGLALDFNDLTEQERGFIEYFYAIDLERITPVVNCYAGIGPKGYGTALVLARIIKVKERILSDRQLAEALKKNDLYRLSIGIDRLAIHAVKHDIALIQDIVFDYIKIGKLSPVLNLNY